jgi:hypothetical protein
MTFHKRIVSLAKIQRGSKSKLSSCDSNFVVAKITRILPTAQSPEAGSAVRQKLTHLKQIRVFISRDRRLCERQPQGAGIVSEFATTLLEFAARDARFSVAGVIWLFGINSSLECWF